MVGTPKQSDFSGSVRMSQTTHKSILKSQNPEQKSQPQKRKLSFKSDPFAPKIVNKKPADKQSAQLTLNLTKVRSAGSKDPKPQITV